jgi:hypothetical protein
LAAAVFILSFSSTLPWIDDSTGIMCPNTVLVRNSSVAGRLRAHIL